MKPASDKTPKKSGDIRSYFKVLSTSTVQPSPQTGTSSSASPSTAKRKAAQLSDEEDLGTELVKTPKGRSSKASAKSDGNRRSKKPRAESSPKISENNKNESPEKTPRKSKSESSKETGKVRQSSKPKCDQPEEVLVNCSAIEHSDNHASNGGIKNETAEGKLTEQKIKESKGDMNDSAELESGNLTGNLKRSAINAEGTENLMAPPVKKKQKESSPEKLTPTRKQIPESSVSKTPESTADDKKRQNASNYFKYLSRGGPRNLGSKDFPEGAPNCLDNMTFVLTGVLDSFERDDVADVVAKYGGRVTTGVSKKTSYVIVGNEAGESKTKKAEAFGIPMISEDDFLEMLRRQNPSASTLLNGNEKTTESSILEKPSGSEVSAGSLTCTNLSNKIKISEPGSNFSSEEKTENVETELGKSSSGGAKNKGAESSDGADHSQNFQKGGNKTKTSVQSTETNVAKNDPRPCSSNGISKTSSSNFSKPHVPPVLPGHTKMWVDKYKPTALKNIVGQTGDRSNSKKLLVWLQNWFQYHGSANDKAKANYPGLRDPDGKTFKAALLSGPPGVGKTTTAHLCCTELNYDYYEMNASDQRSKKGLHEGISDSLSNTTILFPSLATNASKSLARKHVLIMDEVDGMSGNEDRGGVQELIALIKSSRIPIICICNDRNHQKIRSLANYCFDLRFTKPRNEQLKGFIQSICFKEKIKVPPETIQQLIIGTDQDIRQILHQLQLFQDSDSKSVYNPRKDLRLGPWDVIRKVFSSQEHNGMSINDKAGLFFQDYSMGPLFVQENYLRSIPTAAAGSSHKLLGLIKATAESLAIGDCVDNVIRKNSAWSLLPAQAMFSSVFPGEYMEGVSMASVEFPQWLGKNSNRNKRARLIQELHGHVHLQISGSTDALMLDYLPYLRRSIVTPLSRGDIEDAAKQMTSYYLQRDDLESLNDLALWPNMRSELDKLDSKSKAAFTRLVNKESFVPYSVVKVSKGRGKEAAEVEDELEGLAGEDGEDKVDDDEEETDTVEMDAMIKVKKPRAKTSGKPSSKSKK